MHEGKLNMYKILVGNLIERGFVRDHELLDNLQ
jgi:hypothetical protein